jgi:hypothetical protein
VQWRAVADQIRPKVPKLATIMDDAENDVLAYMTFPKEHRVKLHSINPIERLNGEIKRRTEVVGIFPNDDAIVRLVGALLSATPRPWTRSLPSRSRSYFGRQPVSNSIETCLLPLLLQRTPPRRRLMMMKESRCVEDFWNCYPCGTQSSASRV